MGGRVIVVKLGGSVLTDREALRRAVHEIYRWYREGWRVVAVPSALAGETDRRLREAHQTSTRASANAVASAIALGETESAAALGLALDRAGVPARVLSPGAIEFRADGPPLDATPRSVRTGPIERALDAGVCIVPGFLAIGPTGETVTLGRGGSDLSALFLAHRLGADRCRLVKDVDGLYERDPALPGPRPRRFASIAWDEALQLDGSIVQHKAIRFARDHGLAFEVGPFNGRVATVVGPERSVFDADADSGDPVRIALLGLGTVGAGVYHLLSALPGAEVVAVAVRDAAKAHAAGIDPDIVTADPVDAATRGAAIVIEALGGTDTAREVIAAALESGAHVVTANKAVIAAHGPALASLAASRGSRVIASASVGGSVPVLERIRFAEGPRPIGVRGVLNATTNFVLDRVRCGDALHDAIAAAQRAGLAEADPTRDLDGRDAADKLVVLARLLGHDGLSTVSIPRDPLSADRIGCATVDGRIARQVATLDLRKGSPTAAVRIVGVSPGDPLFDVPGEHNAIAISWDDGTESVVRGRGAGRWATAESVVGDVLELIRDGVGTESAPRELEVADVV
jgi:homoserine dehydrogenase